MKTFEVNKGIGRVVEFKGLKAQYLFFFAGGILLVLLLVMIMYVMQVPQTIIFIVGTPLLLMVFYFTFHFNTKYGRYGLMKLQARNRHPLYIKMNKSITRLLTLRNNTIK